MNVDVFWQITQYREDFFFFVFSKLCYVYIFMVYAVYSSSWSAQALKMETLISSEISVTVYRSKSLRVP